MEETVERRFWDKVTPSSNNDCWYWQGSLYSNGYGYLHISGRGRGRKTGLAHKVSYSLHKGPIPEDLVVMHSCDNRSCVNPQHLSLGTRKENMQDCLKKGRFKGGPPLGNKNASKNKV